LRSAGADDAGVVEEPVQQFDAFDSNIAAALDGAESPVAALNAVAYAWQQLGVGA